MGKRKQLMHNIGISGEQGTSLPPRTVTNTIEDEPTLPLEILVQVVK